ncbi:MAG: GNAT family N-acetyltransferase [Verrucomicrobiota bacterium]
MKVILRQAKSSDLEWLAPFYEALMRPIVELTHAWDDNLFREKFEPEFTSIIQLGRENIGMLKVQPLDDHLFLGDIQIAAEHQRKGIGSALVEDILISARQAGLPVRLKVLQGNSAAGFYERFGFREIRELDNCVEMEWQDDSHSRR